MPVPQSKDSIDVLIVSPDSVLFESKATRIIAPGIFQDIAILPDHTPLYAELKAGEIVISTTDGKTEKLTIETGIVRVKSNRASIITGF